MKTFELVCSTDGVGIDYTQIIHADSEPDFWTQYFIAAEHDCDFFHCVEV